jgi:hypothetical protein
MTECHVILTAIHPGGEHISFSGIVYPRPEATRHGLFTQIMTQLAESAGTDPQGLSPLFFSLEPNRLAPSQGTEAS